LLRYRSNKINLGVILKIDVFVAQIIKAPNFNNFTTSDVRSSYITLKNDPSLDPIAVRRKLYAELLKLVKKGWLKKKNVNKKRATRFVKTEVFDVSMLNESTTKNLTTRSSEQVELGNLTKKLKHYKKELLLNNGEADAYKEIYSEFPDLADKIQYQYNKAKENNTRILGKIRAIEGLITQENL
jgi:hypothetical protein